MATEDDIEEAITQPKKAKTDDGEFEAHSLPDQIAAARYVKAQEVAAKPHRALRFARISPPGAT